MAGTIQVVGVSAASTSFTVAGARHAIRVIEVGAFRTRHADGCGQVAIVARRTDFTGILQSIEESFLAGEAFSRSETVQAGVVAGFALMGDVVRVGLVGTGLQALVAE